MPNLKLLSIIAQFETNWQTILETLTNLPKTSTDADKAQNYLKLVDASYSNLRRDIIIATDYKVLKYEYTPGEEMRGLLSTGVSKAGLTDNLFDIFHELSRYPDHLQEIIAYKKIMMFLEAISSINNYPHSTVNYCDVLLADFLILDEIAKQVTSSRGFQLENTIRSKTDKFVCFSCSAFKINYDPKEKLGGLELQNIALQETTPFVRDNSMFAPPPLLYLKYNLLQTQNLQQYKQAINAVFHQNPQDTRFDLLRATDATFFQTPLANAIGMDNTHAALAFISVISESELTVKQESELINKPSKLNPNQTNNPFFNSHSNKIDCAIYSATPLLLAIQRGNTAVVDALCNNPHLDPNGADARGFTPLDWAFIMAEPEIIEKLLALGAQPNQAACFDEENKTFVLERLGKQNHQIYAHFWNQTDSFYADRAVNPNVEKCLQVIEEAIAASPSSLSLKH